MYWQYFFLSNDLGWVGFSCITIFQSYLWFIGPSIISKRANCTYRICKLCLNLLYIYLLLIQLFLSWSCGSWIYNYLCLSSLKMPRILGYTINFEFDRLNEMDARNYTIIAYNSHGKSKFDFEIIPASVGTFFSCCLFTYKDNMLISYHWHKLIYMRNHLKEKNTVNTFLGAINII
jgi:hypothetical protein